MEDVVRQILSRRTPDGYYVIPLLDTPEARRLIEHVKEEGIEVEEAGDILYVKVKPRSVAARIARLAARKHLLAV